MRQVGRDAFSNAPFSLSNPTYKPFSNLVIFYVQKF